MLKTKAKRPKYYANATKAQAQACWKQVIAAKARPHLMKP